MPAPLKLLPIEIPLDEIAAFCRYFCDEVQAKAMIVYNTE